MFIFSVTLEVVLNPLYDKNVSPIQGLYETTTRFRGWLLTICPAPHVFYFQGVCILIDSRIGLQFISGAVPVEIHCFGWWYLERSHEPEPEPLSIGMIPDTLGKLRVLHFPIGIRAPSVSGSELLGVVIPTPATNGAWIEFCWFDEWVRRYFFDT